MTSSNFWANSIELTTSGCVIMTTSWLHVLLGIIHNAKNHKKVCENKETDSPPGIYRMKLPETCSLSKESHEKKMGLVFWGSGTPTFWLGLLLFIKRESGTPTFKILVRTLRWFRPRVGSLRPQILGVSRAVQAQRISCIYFFSSYFCILV